MKNMQNGNKDTLVHEIMEKTELSKKDVEATLECLIDVVTAELRKGNKVTLTGFGTFKVVKRAARTGRNPKTGAAMKIKASKTVRFVPSSALKGSL